MDKQEWVESLLHNWNSNYLLDFGYEMAMLYSTGDTTLITQVIEEFKISVENLKVSQT